ncbi:MAG: kinase/pyrophosphorylase [Alphaproteobacteria bacterium]|nr:MAG: kinase/pyrophosphorylase [Alphaproteobacteria bacterium]
MTDRGISSSARPAETRTVHLHLVSDATGETLEAIATAALVQFEGVEAEKHLWPMVRTPRQMREIFAFIKEKPGLILYTLVNDEVRAELVRLADQLGFAHVSVLDPVITALAHHLGRAPKGQPGRQHALDAAYFQRIEALHYTMAHDDGLAQEDLRRADIILIGVSRTSKTPTSIYLANKGYRTANVPFVPGVPMPPVLDDPALPALRVGLTASPQRLVEIRSQRMEEGERLIGPGNGYTDLQQVREEVRACRRYCEARRIPVIDVTRRSIEETAAAILKLYQERAERMQADGERKKEEDGHAGG